MEVKFLSSESEFVRLGTPKFNSNHIGDLRFPSHLKFNKTYYKLLSNKLIAFRVLAISIDDFEVSYLIEMPKQEPRWIKNFIDKNSIILSNRDDYYPYIGGNKSVNVNRFEISDWKRFTKLLYENGACDNYGNILRTWAVLKDSNQVTAIISTIKYIVLNEDGIYINLSMHNGFRTKEECLRHKLDGFIIEDFDDDDTQIEVEIKVSIRPSKQIIRTIHIIEE
jgi:hypothetical protein